MHACLGRPEKKLCLNIIFENIYHVFFLPFLAKQRGCGCRAILGSSPALKAYSGQVKLYISSLDQV